MTISTVALVCPHCGEKLRSARGDVLMFCTGCSQCLEIHRGLLVDRGLVTLVVEQDVDHPDRDALVRIPVWCFKVRVEFSGPDEDELQSLRRVASPEHVFIAAFRQRSVQAFGDMGLLMTLKPPLLESGEHHRFAGATLCSLDAAKLVEPMVLLRADQIHDVTRIDVTVTIEGVAVVTLPAVDRGDHLTDLVNGKDWPVATFLDIDAIRWKP